MKDLYLFSLGNFTLHSGGKSEFKIDCDALSNNELDALAFEMYKMLPRFGKVEGVPTGGTRLARAIEIYADHRIDDLLIVDDVLTTGNSMEEQRNGREAVGAVIFARRHTYPGWIDALFEGNL